MFNVNGIHVDFFYNREVGAAVVLDSDYTKGRWFEVNGATVCDISFDDGEELLGRGIAYCSVEDNFEKSVGRKVALTRALEDAGLDKDIRTSVWAEYFSMVKK